MSTSTATLRNLRRRQLDRLVARFAGPPPLPPLRRGWIAEVRHALGMSTRQLAHRLGVSQPSVSDLERSERNGGITLTSLRRAAQALDCDLVYAFVPRESFERIVRDRATVVAGRIVGRVKHSMVLEDQGAAPAERVEATTDLAHDLVRTLSRELWEPWD